jgi:hypothetical protein
LAGRKDSLIQDIIVRTLKSDNTRHSLQTLILMIQNTRNAVPQGTALVVSTVFEQQRVLLIAAVGAIARRLQVVRSGSTNE